ncbi:peptide ligase PGM1-related protein [Streptomyces sp. NPDC085614]|uniref:preATP grasp domain-containing protein n=1 Tax=Streptomyces sp. NPDC085614 TaxID=3365733 RepID=UPI0037CCD1D1
MSSRTRPGHAPDAGPGPTGTGGSSPLVVWANFFSDLAVDLTAGPSAHAVLLRWARQAPRKIWLTRPGDVLVTPVPPGPDLTRYACRLLGLRPDGVTVLTVPAMAGVGMAESLERAGLTGALRRLVADRPGARLLPLALDAPTVALADRLGLPVASYGHRGVPASAVEVAYRLNTKSGFRAVADELGLRTPPGRVCDGAGLDEAVAAGLHRHGRVVVKPDRSAGGYGMRFLPDAGVGGVSGPRPAGDWVVERWIAGVRSVSVQMRAGPGGPCDPFCGEMRTVAGAYCGYGSPLGPDADPTGRLATTLGRWGRRLGLYLSAHGYAGPYGLDALLAPDGTLYASECNVRRTATTTVRAMVARLCEEAGNGPAAWLCAEHRTLRALTFADARGVLRASGLDWSAGRGEGVVLHEGAPGDGTTWRYTVIGPDAERLTALQVRLADALGFAPEAGRDRRGTV